MKKLLVRTVALSALLALMGGVAACVARPETTGTPDVGVTREAEAIEVAKARFTEYLKEKPEMKVKDPDYTAVKKKDANQTEYWSVAIELQEPEYEFYYYEVQISIDGEKVTLATG